jgi:hypothetical protein
LLVATAEYVHKFTIAFLRVVFIGLHMHANVIFSKMHIAQVVCGYLVAVFWPMQFMHLCMARTCRGFLKKLLHEGGFFDYREAECAHWYICIDARGGQLILQR